MATKSTESEQSDYLKYRGKCKEMCEQLITEQPELTLVRGHYVCPVWGSQEHWWCIDIEGRVIDPSVRQFPTNGIGAEYIPFNGIVTCEECGKQLPEEDAQFMGNYPVCSSKCGLRLVGL